MMKLRWRRKSGHSLTVFHLQLSQNRSGHKKHALCREACPAHWTKFGSCQQIQEVLGLLMWAGESGGDRSARVIECSAPWQIFAKCFQVCRSQDQALWYYCTRLRWCLYCVFKQFGTLNHKLPWGLNNWQRWHFSLLSEAIWAWNVVLAVDYGPSC